MSSREGISVLFRLLVCVRKHAVVGLKDTAAAGFRCCCDLVRRSIGASFCAIHTLRDCSLAVHGTTKPSSLPAFSLMRLRVLSLHVRA